MNANARYYDLLYLKLKPFFFDKKKYIMFVTNVKPYKKIADDIFGKADQVIANSHKGASCFKETFGYTPPVVNNLYDLESFSPSPKQKENKRIKIICVASFQARKRPFLFANIAKKVKYADFVWVGEGPFKIQIIEKIYNEKIKNLEIKDKMLQSDLATYLKQFDVFLFPSIQEGFPSVVVEAMACGLPVIAFNMYDPEAVVNEETGYVVTSEFEMLEKVKYLIKNRDTLSKFKSNARKRALEYSGQKLVFKLQKIIEDLIIYKTEE